MGVDVYSQIILQGIYKGNLNAPIAQNTLLGWVITGLTCPQVQDCLEPPSFESNLCINSYFTQKDSHISDALTKFWEVEQIPKKSFLTVDEKACEEHFLKTTFRFDGRFGVRNLFSVPNPSFPGSKDIALKSLVRLRARLTEQPHIKEEYDTFMREYLELGHMVPIPSHELEP